jgi:perosamine synthetase
MAVAFPIRLFQPAFSAQAEQAALRTLRSGQIASGPLINEFQQRLGERLGHAHLVCTSDMTSALVLALRLAGVQVGDEVLTLAFSCMSSNSAIHMVGATPVWVDMDPSSASMLVEDLERAVTPRCKAVTLYHVAGYPGPSEAVAEFCRRRGIAFIEDCNNAMGATLRGKPLGAWGDYAVYSFYPNRQLNAMEGGALSCPDAESAARAVRLRRFGIDASTFRDPMGEINPASDIPEIGESASFSQLNSAVGLEQLTGLDVQLDGTRAVAERLQQELKGLAGIQLVQPIKSSKPAYWALLLLAEKRDALMSGLKKRGIDCSKLHWRNDGYTGFHAAKRSLPGTDRFMQQCLALPCGWWLSDEQVQFIVDAVYAEVTA